MSIHHGKFDADDLIRVEGDFVVLNSGSPLLKVVCVEGDNVLCEWEEEGETKQALIPSACLSRLVPFKES